MSRVALITGGTRGIGKAISLALKDAGFRVAANYLGNIDAARQFSEETGIPTYRFDVASFTECDAATQRISEELGPIDILVNNAGITRDATFHRMTVQQWSEVMQTNLNSLFNMTRAVINPMRERSFGRIINIGSLNGQTGQFGQVNYSAAKAGLMGFTKALALESAAKGITVNTVAPGYTATEMVQAVPQPVLDKIVARIPAGRLGYASDIARCVLFLASDDASFITGATFSINGGQHMH